ncbi:MAG: hypothetical protein ACRBHB_05045 [Arenicella sp.]
MSITNTIVSRAFIIALVALMLSACGSNKKQIPISVLSDPLGAYAMIKVEYKEKDQSDWIFLGPTPVKLNRSINFKKATRVSIKVVKEGFFEQVKTWPAKEFLKEYKDRNKVLWLPSLVQN